MGLRTSNGGDGLLALLQITNAAFPTGAFTHSLGFETWISDGALASAAQAQTSCRDWLRFNLATCDAAGAALAHRCAAMDDRDGLIAVDTQLGALKLSREARQASAMTGAALAAAGRAVFALPRMSEVERLIGEGACQGHHAMVYGVLASELRLTEDQCVVSYLWSGLSSLIGVIQRLLPMGQADAQRIIADAAPLIERCAEIARTRDLATMATAYAALDAASMQHERLPTRLCIS
ncbi:urease accessory protein UreF [Chelatococcus reniformis]|uniref:Urease accessory protein UreF n=1 Tax=Chelatococcus reniformis TaxID=1494448 RepID=A0A916XBR5_9HYPH|nr:urease accessory UreF family protein [Chelatococcus reniformis]GGC59024.1 urease accessory protein UreF [Chelatococcus reniformis]